MDGLLAGIAQWVVVVIIGLGLIVTLRKNGRSADRREGARTEKITSLERITQENSQKLDKVLAGQNEQKAHCAGVSTGLNVRVDTLEKKGE